MSWGPYGDRRYDTGLSPVTRLQAMLVELLAGGVAAGLARLEQEQAAARARVLFEQFFTRELSQQLTLRPDMLEGRDEEVTVLFCDIRAFSRMTQNAGAAKTMEWLSDVLGALSECVLDTGGVLIDYVGDELMALWGAPAPQEDHAARACSAALQMLGRVPALDARWQSPRGAAPAGDRHQHRPGAGRQRRHRVQAKVRGAGQHRQPRQPRARGHEVPQDEGTHHRGDPARLDTTFARRRLRDVRVVNIRGPVSLYELAAPGREGWAELKANYEKALGEFEARHFRAVAHTLAPLVSEEVNDGPSLVLMAQAVGYLVEEPEQFDPAWELPGK